jgi:hypothetical protein
MTAVAEHTEHIVAGRRGAVQHVPGEIDTFMATLTC